MVTLNTTCSLSVAAGATHMLRTTYSLRARIGLRAYLLGVLVLTSVCLQELSWI